MTTKESIVHLDLLKKIMEHHADSSNSHYYWDKLIEALQIAINRLDGEEL